MGTTKLHPYSNDDDEEEYQSTELRAAETAFLNSPHPLDIMSDPSAYGPEGAISRYHDPRSYRKSVNHVMKQTVRCLQRRKRIERWHLNSERMAEVHPSLSPVDITKRPKRKTADSCVMFCPYDGGFFHRSSSVAACNYLQINRNRVNRMTSAH